MTRPMRDAWAETLRELAVDNPDLLVLDGDLASSTRADRFAAAHPDRFLQMGIAEQNLVGVAAGLATLGYVPWLSSFAVFFTHRAIDPIRMLVAQTHANVKIGAAYTGLLTGFTGKTHQDVEDLAIMRAMPGMTVIAPCDASECVAAVRWATETQGPVYLRLARDAGPDVFDDAYRFEPSRVIPIAHRVRRPVGLDRCPDRRGPSRRPRSSRRGGSRRRPPRPLPETGRCGRDRRGGTPASRSSSPTEEHTVPGRSRRAGRRDPQRARAAPARADRDRRHPANRPRTPSCSTGTGCRRSASRSAWRSSCRRSSSSRVPQASPDDSGRGDQMSRFTVKDPNSIGVALLGAGGWAGPISELAAIPNARVVVVADPDGGADAGGSSGGRSGPRPTRSRRSATRRRRGRDRHADQHACEPHRGGAAGRQGGLDREADRPGPRRDRPGRRPLARDRHPGPGRLHAPLRPGLRPGQGADRRGRAGPDRAVPRLLARHVPAAARVPATRRLVPGHGVHDLDLARFLVGEVEEVHAWASVLFDERFAKAATGIRRWRCSGSGTARWASWRRPATPRGATTSGRRWPGRSARSSSRRPQDAAHLSRRVGDEGDLYEDFRDRFEVAYRRELEVFFRTWPRRTPSPGPTTRSRRSAWRSRASELARGPAGPPRRGRRMAEVPA